MTITGEWVAQARGQLGLSREKFATHVGLTPGAIWRIEVRGVFRPGELDRLSEVLGSAAAGGAQSPAEPPTPVTVPVASNSAPAPVGGGPSTQSKPVTFHGLTVPKTHVAALTTPSSPLLTTVPPVALNRPEPDVLGEELSPYQRFLQDGVRRYSNSEVQTFKRCRRKWYLAYYLRYHLANQSPVGARAIGDRLHRALRWHYHPDPQLRVDARDALEVIIRVDHAELVKRYAPELVPLGLETKFSQEADLERVMIAGYVEWVQQTGADSEFIVTGAEEYVEAALQLPSGQHVRLVGRLDARARRISDGARLFIDHKSVGSIEGATQTLVLNEQMKMYILLEHLVAEQEGGDPGRVDGAIFNMLRRCKRTAQAKPPFYQRVEVRHNPTAIANFQLQLTAVIQQIENTRTALDDGGNHRELAVPTPASDCTWSCDFMRLDTLMDDGSKWEAMANAFYEVGDPSSYYVKHTDVHSVQ